MEINGIKARARLQPVKQSEDLHRWASGIRRLALCLRFSPAQNQFSSLSQTIKATCSFLQMTYCFQSGFGIFYGMLKIKSGSQLPVSHFCAESEGFEPPDPLRSTVFKTAAFDHSANSPIYFPFVRDCKGTNIFVTCKLFYSFCFIFLLPWRNTCIGRSEDRMLRRSHSYRQS